MKKQERVKKLGEISARVAELYGQRLLKAQKTFADTVQEINFQKGAMQKMPTPADFWQAWSEYATDFMQRSVLFWDTLCRRGNIWMAHEKEEKPPVLIFDHELIVDGRKLERPVNYVLLRIIPPQGTVIDETKNPFIIIDPRAGHGPGIGGSKQESEIGMAIKAGYPVYFVSFFPVPMAGQTLPDITAAEVIFLKTVIERHPDSPKPIIMGNCQGGWAAMLLAATVPDMVGTIIMNGAPLSYWSGSGGKNPMRYSGGLLGGTWTALFASDLGDGTFDGAYLVDNFEKLNPANSLWDKYYHLFSNIDTEQQRFLDFEKWWGGFFLMNEAEISWIVENLFIGNKLTRGEVQAGGAGSYDLKAIRSPIIVFASMGDNITPPEQAFNWIIDLYASTEELKANGQVIIVLMHEDIGHLGIFVSGKVAQKEHAKIVKLTSYVDMLQPGLYSMSIQEIEDGAQETVYTIALKEIGIGDIRGIDEDGRADELPFEAVKSVSEFTEKAYSFFWRPFVQALANEENAKILRLLHPQRIQRWGISDLNPLMWPITLMAPIMKDSRKPAREDNPFHSQEKKASRMLSASLDLYRDLRDAWNEALFFRIYAPMLVVGMVDADRDKYRQFSVEVRNLPLVRDTLSAIDKGGYIEAMARIGALLEKEGSGEISFDNLQTRKDLAKNVKAVSKLSEDEKRRIKNEQSIIVEFEPERALETLPLLLGKARDRGNARVLLEEVAARTKLNVRQRVMLERIMTII